MKMNAGVRSSQALTRRAKTKTKAKVLGLTACSRTRSWSRSRSQLRWSTQSRSSVICALYVAESVNEEDKAPQQ